MSLFIQFGHPKRSTTAELVWKTASDDVTCSFYGCVFLTVTTVKILGRVVTVDCEGEAAAASVFLPRGMKSKQSAI